MAQAPRKPQGASEQFGDRRLADMQARVDRLERAIALCPFFFGKLKSVSFTGGVHKTVNHGLGVPAAFLVVRANYEPAMGGQVHAESSVAGFQSKLNQNTQLSILCNQTVNLDLWFYPRASKPIRSTGESD